MAAARTGVAGLLAALSVSGLAAASLLLVLVRWDWGMLLLGLTCLLAGVIRLTFPTVTVRYLAVRGRTVDALCYLGLGVALLLVTLSLRQTYFGSPL